MLYLEYFSEILFPTSVKPRGQPRGRGTCGGSGRGSQKKPSSPKKTKCSSSSSDEGNFGLEIYHLHFACKYVSHLLKTIDIFYLMHIRQRKRWQGQE